MANIPFNAYKGTEPYIFISYGHKDSDRVFPVITEFHTKGYPVWYDEGIDPGNEWPEEIANALAACSLFVVFISPSSVESENVRNEINLALKKKKPFIAIYLEDTELTPGMELQIGSKQAIMQFRMEPEDFYYKCFQSIEKYVSPSLKQKAAATAAPKAPASVPSGDVEALVIQGDAVYVAKDSAEAAAWYAKAAAQGHAEAQFNLGKAYHFGEGVPQDKGKAAEWLAKAAAQGHENAKEALEILGIKAVPSAVTGTSEAMPTATKPSVEALLQSAKAHFDAKEYDAVIADCTEAIRLDPNNACAYYSRGMAYSYKGDNYRFSLDYLKAESLPRLTSFCGYCGAALKSGISTCPKCGKEVVDYNQWVKDAKHKTRRTCSCGALADFVWEYCIVCGKELRG
jgi:tetratricopeptide (TPR) repeat protein